MKDFPDGDEGNPTLAGRDVAGRHDRVLLVAQPSGWPLPSQERQHAFEPLPNRGARGMKTERAAVGQHRLELPLTRQDGPVAPVAMVPDEGARPKRRPCNFYRLHVKDSTACTPRYFRKQR